MSKLPLTRLSPWYPGQMGVYGSDVQRGIRASPTAIVLYVDENHPGASAVADGTDPENPLNSIQTAVNRLITFQTAMATSLVGSVIVVGAGATIVESVVVPPTAPAGCTIIGDTMGGFVPSWRPATTTGIALTLEAPNWRVSGFRFYWTGNGIGVRLSRAADDSWEAYACQVDNNRFFGGHTGLHAIEFYGAPSNCRILNNEFGEIHSTGMAGTAYAICCAGAAVANPYLEYIAGNTFWECENYIGSSIGHSFNVSIIEDNIFHPGTLIPAAIKIDLRGGTRGANIVTRNVFYGDYSNAGGYWAHAAAPDFWGGNFSDDIAEAEVGDNGLTTAPPS